MKKRLLRCVSLIIVALTVLNLFSVILYAAPTTEIEEKRSIDLSVSNATGVTGGSVNVNINLSNNVGLSSLKFNVVYDEALTLTNVEFNKNIKAQTTSPVPFKNPQPLSIISPLTELDYNGLVATLTFELNSDVEDGYIANIRVEYDSEDVFDENYDNILVEIVNGSVIIYDKTPGDIDEDNLVTNKDAILLFRYAADWDVDVDEAALDVNGDGRVNNKDAIELFRSVAGWDKIVLYRGKICNHAYEYTVGKEATCTENGMIENWYCAQCDKYYLDSQGINQTTVEELIIKAKGHNEVVDPAIPPTYNESGWTEGSHCSLCNECIKPQVEIPCLQPNKYSITYRNTKNIDIPMEYTTYISGKMLELPSIEKDGYKFLGWYTKSIGGELVDYIQADSAQNYILYAQWDTVKYTITYNDAAVHTNPLEYTIEDSFVLTDPEWSGLKFVSWVDKSGKFEVATENGQQIVRLNKGTTGNIEISATWQSYRNLVIPKQDSQFEWIYDEDLEKYIFITELGMISNVIISEQFERYEKTTSADKNVSLSNTVSIEKSIASSIIQTVAKSVTKTDEWKNVADWAYSISNGLDTTVSTEIDVGTEDLIKTSLGLSFGVSISNNEQWSNETETGGYVSENGEESMEISSTIAYLKQMSTTSTDDITISGDMPNGHYLFAHTGSIRVFAIVTYDPTEEKCYINTYSVLDNMRNTILYFANEYDITDTTCDGLECNIPTDKIEGVIESSYYVEYNANGGSGEMLLSALKRDEDQKLQLNKFSKEGYIFAGWQVETDNTVTVYTDGQTVNNIAKAGEKIVLNAMWTPKQVKVNFDANGGTVDADSKLFVYDGKYSDLPTPTKVGYSFEGWLLDGTKVTEETTVKTVGDHKMVASWSANKYLVTYNANGGIVSIPSEEKTFDNTYANLPTPIRTGYIFDGWVIDSIKVNINTIVKTPSDHILVATWIPITYTVVYNANGGEGTTVQSNHTYDSEKALSANGFSRHGWSFLGWSTNKNASKATYTNAQKVSNLTSQSNGQVILYAIWEIKTTHAYTYNNGIDINNFNYQGPMFNLSNNFDINSLAALEYKYDVVIEYDIRVNGDHLNAVCHLDIGVVSDTSGGIEIFSSGKMYYGDNATGHPVHNISNRKASELLGKEKAAVYFEAEGVSVFDVLNHYTVSNFRITFNFHK